MSIVETDSREVGWRHRLYVVIFEHGTPAGKAFDVALLLAIFSSILVVMLDSVESIRLKHGEILFVLEWGLTLLFLLEYVFRIISAKKPISYITSFLGIVDLLSILPTFVSLILPGSEVLLTIRSLRLLRGFRVLELSTYMKEANGLVLAIQASSRKIIVFLGTVLTLAIIMGSLWGP